MAVSLTKSTFLANNSSLRPAKTGWNLVHPSVIPGFGLTFGYAVTYLSLIVLIPIAVLFWKAASMTPERFIAIATDPRTVTALWVSFGSSFIAALVNVVFGVIVA